MSQPPDVSLRPETPEDLPFLRDLYLSTREGAPKLSELPEDDRRRSLLEAFELEHRQHRAHAHTWFTIIMIDEKPAGRLYVSQSPSEMRVLDLSLLPEHRRHGIGSQLLESIQSEAGRSQVPLRLRVAHGSSALEFYRELGFSLLGEGPTHHLLEWRGELES